MTPAISRPAGAALLAVAAAFLWAAYYPLVLGVPNAAAPSGLLAWPFLVAGVAFSLVAIRRGEASELRRLWTDPAAWSRVALLVIMQASVIAATYLAGAVDTALLSLIGDVVVTPILLVAIYREGQVRTRSIAFVAGVTACTLGAILTIVATGTVRPLTGLALAVAPVCALAIALYFLLTARANRSAPVNAVLGQISVAGGVVALLASPVIPGGVAGLMPRTPVAALALLVIGVVCFYVAPAFYFAAIERAGMILPAVLMATIPVFTLLLSWLVLGVIPPPLGLLGIPIAVVGAAIALRGEHEPWTTSYPPAPPTAGAGP